MKRQQFLIFDIQLSAPGQLLSCLCSIQTSGHCRGHYPDSLRFWAWFPNLAQPRILLVQRPLKTICCGTFLLVQIILSLCKSHLRTCFYSACQYVCGKHRGYIEKMKEEKLWGFLDSFLQKYQVSQAHIHNRHGERHKIIIVLL